MQYLKSTFISILLSFILMPLQAYANEIATVVEITQNVHVERVGGLVRLELGDSLLENDRIITDNSGRVQLVFSDNSIITIGADSSFVVEDYSVDAEDPSFYAELLNGVARIVSGNIVENNPNAFSVTTPQATIGIRGTTMEIGVNDNANLTTVNVTPSSEEDYIPLSY